MRARTLPPCCGLTLFALLAVMAPASAVAQPGVKTSKERLSDKASDEQRVDNCRVAPERRGGAPRPDCSGETSSRVPPTGQRQAQPPKSR